MLSTELCLGDSSAVRTYSKEYPLHRLPWQLGRWTLTANTVAKLLRSRTQGRSSLVCKSQQVAPDEEFDWAARFEGTLRTVPLAAGALGIVGVLVNRLVSGIAPVVDASSAQSRADVLVIGLSAVLVLTGLQWLSLKPKPVVAVEPDAEYVSYIDSKLPEEAKAELQWSWRALRFATRCRGVVAFHKGRCIMHCGMAAPGTVPGSATVGPIGAAAMKSGSGNYLANLILFPGRVEFTKYLPKNTQGVLVQPIGEDGLLVCGTDTQRGFGRLDQAWIAAIAEKLDIALRETEECLERVKVVE